MSAFLFAEFLELIVLGIDYAAMKEINKMIGVDVVLAFFMVTIFWKYHNYFMNHLLTPPEILIRLIADGMIVTVYFYLSIKRYKRVHSI